VTRPPARMSDSRMAPEEVGAAGEGPGSAIGKAGARLDAKDRFRARERRARSRRGGGGVGGGGGGPRFHRPGRSTTDRRGRASDQGRTVPRRSSNEDRRRARAGAAAVISLHAGRTSFGSKPTIRCWRRSFGQLAALLRLATLSDKSTGAICMAGAAQPGGRESKRRRNKGAAVQDERGGDKDAARALNRAKPWRSWLLRPGPRACRRRFLRRRRAQRVRTPKNGGEGDAGVRRPFANRRASGRSSGADGPW